MADRSVRVKLSADVHGATRGLERVADKSNEAGRGVSALERRLQQLAAQSAEPKVNLDSDEARRRLTNVQERLTKLGASTAEAKARVDDADSQAKLSRIEAQLLRVGSQTANPDIDLAGVAAAESELTGLQSQLQRFDGNDYRAQVHVNGTVRASRNIRALTAAAITLGPTIVPAAAAASGAMLGLASASGVAVAGAGSASLAFMGVGDALGAMSDAETAAASNASDMARKQVTASRQVEDAKRQVAQAERNRAQVAQEGARRIADAQRDVVEARREAQDAAEAAADRVTDAQDNLRRAHERVRFALEDLHAARQQAIRDLRDLREETRDNALSIEGAEISLARARERLREETRSGTASELDLREARLRVREAEDRLSDARRKARRDRADLTEAEREGISQADVVVSARRNVQEAERGVSDAKDQLAEATENAADVQRESARNIAEAERDLARTREQVATRNQQASRQIADAQRSVRRALEDMNQTMGQSSSEAEKLREAMDGLSPAGRRFVRFLHSLKPRLEELQAIAQEGMFPGVQAGIEDLLTLFPVFEDLVRNSSEAMGGLAEDAGEALTSPFWREFFNWLADEAGPTLDSFGRIAGNVTTGLAGMTMASDDLADGFVADLERMSERFATWGKQLGESEEFQQFVEYVQRVSPKVWSTLGQIAETLIAIAEAAAPVGELSLPIIRGLAGVLEGIAESSAGPVLVGAATGLVALNSAIRGYSAVRHSQIVTALGGMRDNARGARGRMGRLARFIGSGGPWGLALAGATIGLGFWMQKQAEAEQHVEDLTESLDDQSGALTRNTKQLVVKRLEEQGALELARQHGISLETVTRAALGNEQAQRKLRKEIDKINRAHTNWGGTVQGDTEPALDRLRKTVLGESGAVQESRRKHDRMKTAMDAVTKASNKAEGQGRDHETQLHNVGRQLNRTREQTQRLIDKYGNVPDNVRTFFNADTKNARKKIGALSDYTNKELSNMRDRVLNIKFTGGMGGMRAGGPVVGPGTDTSDSIPARLSRGEHVWTAREVRGAGGHQAVEGLRQRATRGFAEGGPVMDDFERVNLRFRASRSGFERVFDQMAKRFAASGGRGLAFARAQDGEPYVWGGVGPHGWDCSGLWSGVVNAIRGRNPNSRLFSTHSFAGGSGAAGFVRGLASPVMVGVDPGSHMAGTINGVNVESSGSHGVRVGPDARGARHPMFDYRFGLARAGGRANDRALANEGILADRGATLPHGSWALNTSGTTEAVLSGPQWRTLQTVAEAVRPRPVTPMSTAGGDGAASVTYSATFTGPVQRPTDTRRAVMDAFRDMDTLHPVR